MEPMILKKLESELYRLKTCLKTSRCGNSHKNLTILELLEGSQITKCDGFCRNYCVLLKISKELSCKFFKVLGQVLI
ncbi:hypothetical protein DV30_00275 [Leptospira interrogans serovar Canicola str. Gui44]|nr:hypothetical protein DV30_00275 [Leptospira interrogans serovar Canicola str. Gui44]